MKHNDRPSLTVTFAMAISMVGAIFTAITQPAAAQAVAAQSAVPGPLVRGQGTSLAIAPGWRVVTLPAQKVPVTRFSAVLLEARPVIRIDANSSYGNLVYALSGPPPRELRWSWRVDQANPLTELRERGGDDSPAKVCLSFDMALGKVPLLERELLSLARTRSGQALPAATLCYAWGRDEAKGSLIPNAFSRRVRYIVLRGAAEATGGWFDEARDVAADFRLAFGDESAEAPPLSAVLVGGDADNTRGHSIAYVSGLRFTP